MGLATPTPVPTVGAAAPAVTATAAVPPTEAATAAPVPSAPATEATVSTTEAPAARGLGRGGGERRIKARKGGKSTE